MNMWLHILCLHGLFNAENKHYPIPILMARHDALPIRIDFFSPAVTLRFQTPTPASGNSEVLSFLDLILLYKMKEIKRKNSRKFV